MTPQNSEPLDQSATKMSAVSGMDLLFLRKIEAAVCEKVNVEGQLITTVSRNWGSKIENFWLE